MLASLVSSLFLKHARYTLPHGLCSWSCRPLGLCQGFPPSSVNKESACNAEDLGLSLGREDPLEKEIATYSNILAWKIPWTEDPGGLQSKGSQDSSTTEQLTLSPSLFLDDADTG